MKLAVFMDCFLVKFAPKVPSKLVVVSVNLLLKILGNLTLFYYKRYINPSEIVLDCKLMLRSKAGFTPLLLQTCLRVSENAS